MFDRDTLLGMAREAGFPFNKYGLLQGDEDGEIEAAAFFKRYAELVAAEERKACADIVENAHTPDCGGWTAQGIADAIRARGATNGKPT